MPTLTGNSRRREQRLQELMLNRQSQRFERRLSREIARAMREGANNYADGQTGYAEAVKDRHERNLTRLLTNLWEQSGQEMAEHILGVERSWAGKIEAKRARGLDVNPTTIMDTAMRDWIATEGGLKITRITNTTLHDIRAAAAVGIRQGLSERDIADLISQVAPTKSASRAQTIARTEVHAASQFSAQASAESTGLNMVRVWVSAQSERTRPDHDDADGQQRGMNEPFNVGGDLLLYPGDPNGRAEQVINCRCAVVYELA